jgi:hypothetical protein
MSKQYLMGCDYVDLESPVGTVVISQIEDSHLVSVEVFPENQSKESFEDAEFNNIVDIREVAVDSDFFHLRNMPKCDWETEHKVRDVVIFGIRKMIATIQNMEDLRDEMYIDGSLKIPVYESYRVIREMFRKSN